MDSDARLSADIGGTFTDIVLDARGKRLTRKVLTTPHAPEEGVLEGITLVLADAGLALSDINVFVHGTTLATNAIIERRGARTALVATEGFRDVLAIGTESRFDQYDIMLQKPQPLVPRDLRFTLRERMDARGRVQIAPNDEQIRQLGLQLAAAGVESVAVAFLHAYANPAHELRVRDILADVLPPGITLSLSCEVCPQVREYERTSTTVANAYVQPLMAGYLARLDQALKARHFAGTLYLVTSSGGLTSLEAARTFPVRLVESGPAGGAIFAARISECLREKRVLSFDMGGTTAKICLIERNEPAQSRIFEVDRTARFLKGSGLPLCIPVIEMIEIGAGGGSIARLDAMKRVTVGPESASSVPGPAAYGRGGTRPTVTDADVMLGLLRPEGFAGGSLTLQPALSARALSDTIGTELSLSAEMAAHAVYEIVCESMASAARVHAAERGAVMSQHTMVAFGGAAPLHAARVAEKLGVRRLVIPNSAGVGSAVGFLTAPISYEIARSHHTRIDEHTDYAAISALLSDMEKTARSMVQTGSGSAPLLKRTAAFMRYVGQGHEIMVELPDRPLCQADAHGLREAFTQEYARQFARSIPNAPIEVLNWSVRISTIPSPPVPFSPAGAKITLSPLEIRRFFDGGSNGWTDLPVYDRACAPSGAFVPGPAIIVEKETTTYVSARFDAQIDGSGNIIMNQKDAA